jgi:glycosyltransferase involved in cell wall biosynthesis
MLLIVGEGSAEASLRSQAAALGLGAAVSFCGYCEPDDLPALLAGAHTLVLSSHREVWGLVVNEALAAGLHAVTTSVAGVTRTVRQMAGVFPYDGSLADLRRAMRDSRAAWRGPLAEPEILTCSPARMAKDALDATELAWLTRHIGSGSAGRRNLRSSISWPSALAAGKEGAVEHPNERGGS